MSGRRSLAAVVLLAACLHGFGISRTLLPAQDGLKFLRTARGFQNQPWLDVVRGSDQHPLYPALVALTEPAVAACLDRGPDAWRIAGQLVSAAASLALLVPLHGLTRRLFDGRIADLAVLGYVLLPLPMEVGRDTLSDSLALCFFLWSLRFGLDVPYERGWAAAVGCGLTAGVGFLARPEVLVAPMAVVFVGTGQWLWRRELTTGLMPRLAGVSIAFLVMVGGYALAKGEVSEKLALRTAANIGTRTPARKTPHWLPPGLDDPRWDFSPKEETIRPAVRAAKQVVVSLGAHWLEGLGVVLGVMAVWGLVRDGAARRMIAAESEPPDADHLGRALVGVYLALFTLVLARHELRLGYLSDRHLLTLVTLSLPWSAAGVFLCATRLSRRWGPQARRWAARGAIAMAVATGILVQAKPAHASRWGHREAGLWLAAHAAPGEAVLDTRGWAAFVSGRPSYDYWHVRQAISDARLGYVVVGDDELNASTPRGATLRSVLSYAASPVAAFSEREGGHDTGVWVYRYVRPESWEGLRP